MDLVSAVNGLQRVPLVIEGKPKSLILATAAGISVLTKAAVADLGLRTASTGGAVRMLGRNGSASASYVVAKSFSIGGVQGKDFGFMVLADSGTGTSSTVDGGLAMDMIGSYDVELDFARHKLNLFSTDHCDGRVVYWPAEAVAVVPYSSVKPGSGVNTHIVVPVMLEGKRLLALIDTGSARSTMSAGTARYTFQVTEDSPGAVPLGTLGDNPRDRVFGHVFESLTFEGVTVRNAHVAILPDLVGSKDPYNGRNTGSMIKRADDDATPDLTLGMDVLRRMHLYIATRERKLYITPPGPAPAGAE